MLGLEILIKSIPDDKVEFKIIIGEYSFDFYDRVKKTIPNILTNKELLIFK